MANWDKWPSALHPKELLFFSADVVGSTSVKQTFVPTTAGVIPDMTEWFRDLQAFYIDSVDLFFQQYEGAPKDEGHRYEREIKQPRVWKTIGDEILFWVELTDTRQVLIHIRRWMKAMEQLKERLAAMNLDVKCTAWIAHFPWRNKIIFTSPKGYSARDHGGKEDNNLRLTKGYFEALEGRETDLPKDLVPDFVGPGMDIGFRLGTQASQRRFVVSTDVVYMLAMTIKHFDMREDVFKKFISRACSF